VLSRFVTRAQKRARLSAKNCDAAATEPACSDWRERNPKGDLVDDVQDYSSLAFRFKDVRNGIGRPVKCGSLEGKRA
jgi:hypothetical protein